MEKRRRDLIPAIFAKCDVDDVRQREAIKHRADRVSNVEHQHSQTAVEFIRAGAARVARLANAPNWRQGSVDQSDDSAKLYPLHGSRERIATKLSAPAFHVSGRFKLCKNLFEKLDWQFFFYGQFAYLEHWPAEFGGDSEIDQRAKRIFAAFRQFHILSNW